MENKEKKFDFSKKVKLEKLKTVFPPIKGLKETLRYIEKENPA